MADFLSTAFHYPAVAAWYISNAEYDPNFCLALVLVAQATSMASSLSLLCLNVDKFLYVTYSIKYELYVSQQRALLATASVWAVSIGWALVFVTNFINGVGHGCSYSGIETTSYIVFSVCFFILPTILSLIISIHIAVIVSRYTCASKLELTAIKQQNQLNAGNCKRHSINQRCRWKPLKRITFIFTTTVWTVITCLPYRLLFMLRLSESPNGFYLLRYILYGVMSANAAGNPIITLFTLKLYRTCTVKMFKKCVMTQDVRL
jgi:hypothetical protein